MSSMITITVDVNERDSIGRTRLMTASYKGNLSEVNFLLENKADVLLRNHSESALLIAASRGHSKIVETLLKHGANANDIDSNKRTALILAVMSRDLESVRCLLMHGANVNDVDSDGRTSLMLAAMHGDSEIVRCLLENGADLSITDKGFRSAIFFAIGDATETLLEAGADVNSKSPFYGTALWQASERGDIKRMTVLLKAGANVHLSDSRKYTPLIIAANRGHKDAVELLLKAGAYPCDNDSHNNSAIYHANYMGHREIGNIIEAERDRQGLEWYQGLHPR